ncbi:AI-2E family transporter [Silvibacterium acidisoli]|uniref:AI-2E family transporter n=1 Tax=Acidobacteriaceae bacterium ZG23-2 TaxID=2883246 RepID=UPI00406CEDBD
MAPNNSNRSSSAAELAALFLLTLAAVVVCALIVRPFLSGIVFAITIAVCTRKPYNWLAGRIRNPSLCAAVAMAILLIGGIIPVIEIGRQLVVQGAAVVTTIRSGAANAWLQRLFDHHPALASRVQQVVSQVDLNSIMQAVAGWAGRHFVRLLGDSISVIIQIVVLLFLLFFLWRDEQTAKHLLRSLLPMRKEEAEEVIGRLHDTIYATGFGRLAVAATQGILGGLAYWVLGVPGAVFWGFLTALFALIPGFGAALGWGPIALYLGLSGEWGRAAILAAWGGGFVSLIDNFLYPILVGSRLRSHTAIIFLSLLGGVALFGASGIILGPLMFSLATSLLAVWQERQAV